LRPAVMLKAVLMVCRAVLLLVMLPVSTKLLPPMVKAAEPALKVMPAMLKPAARLLLRVVPPKPVAEVKVNESPVVGVPPVQLVAVSQLLFVAPDQVSAAPDAEPPKASEMAMAIGVDRRRLRLRLRLRFIILIVCRI
jgi:hypothetical protein